MEKKRHCMIVHHTYPLAEPRVEREALALVKAGFDVDVICLRLPGEPAFEIVEGVNVYRLPVQRDKRRGIVSQFLEYLAFFGLASFKLIPLYSRRKYKVVEAHNLPDFLVFAALWPKLFGAHVILNIHDVMPEFYAARFKSGMNSWPVRLVRWQEWVSCKFADHVITVTELWRQSLVRRGVPARKVSVVMNLADGRVYGGEHVKEKQAENSHSLKLIYHGTISRRYGLDILVNAIARVRPQIPDIHLTIHGNGEFRDTVMELVTQLNLSPNVHFSVKKLPTVELPKLILQADVGVIPYRNDVFTDEILPTKLMEYTALGIPSIAARTTAIQAYFTEDMVQFFTPGDVDDLSRCILLLNRDSARRAFIAGNVRKFNDKYNWTSQAKDYVNLVNTLAK